MTDMVGGGGLKLQPRQWTDDTSMALCLGESLLMCHSHNARDQMTRYTRWADDWSSTGGCFDIGITVRTALAEFEEGRQNRGGPRASTMRAPARGCGSRLRLAVAARAGADLLASRRRDRMTRGDEFVAMAERLYSDT